MTMTREIVGAQDYTNVAQDLLARAAKHGATAADVMVADGETSRCKSAWGRSTPHKAREKRLGLRVFFGHRSMSASTSDFSHDCWIGSWEKPVPWPRLWSRTRCQDCPSRGTMPPELPDLEHLRRHETCRPISKSICTPRRTRGVCGRFPYYQLEGGDCDPRGRIILRIVMGFGQ